MAPRGPLRIAFIGDGGISHSVRETLRDATDLHFETCAILCRKSSAEEQCVTNVEDLLARKPDVVVECAGHSAVSDYGPAILAAGVPFLVISIGSLADEELLNRLQDAARAGGTRLILAAGAMAGIDALAAARLGGLVKVRYTGRKPPAAWKGTAAEALCDLDRIPEPATFYQGTARDAALRYPKNSNVAATIALAGLGFDQTEVELVADPGITKNIHELMFEGADGRFEVSICGEPSQSNPKTSALTAHSIARLLAGMGSPLVI